MVFSSLNHEFNLHFLVSEAILLANFSSSFLMFVIQLIEPIEGLSRDFH